MKESNVLFENLIFMHWLQDAVFFLTIFYTIQKYYIILHPISKLFNIFYSYIKTESCRIYRLLNYLDYEDHVSSRCLI